MNRLRYKLNKRVERTNIVKTNLLNKTLRLLTHARKQNQFLLKSLMELKCL